MTKQDAISSGASQAGELHREAEQRLRDRNVTPIEDMIEVDVRALLHELQVHQIELEMQNEELLHAQMAVQEVSDKYQDLFDFAPIGYFLLDEQGRILQVNLAGAALLGVDRSAAVKQRFGQYVTPKFRGRLAEFLREMLEDDGKQTCEIELRRAREVVHAAAEGIRAHDRGRNTYFRIAITDITVRKQAEGEVRALNETLEQRVAERTSELAHRAEELRALSAELTLTEQRERRRLAQVLHDDLQQMLVAARMKLGSLRHRVQDYQSRESIGQIDELLDRSITESRSLATQLSPPVLYECGLAAALNWLAREKQAKFGLAVEVEADGAAEPVDEAAKVFLFQATRELLLNVAKHAQAHRVWVRMQRTEDHQVEIEVRDDGVGFDPARPAGKADRGGFGMFSIRERLAVLGGRMEVLSSPGQGTQVRIQMPI